MTSCSPWTGLSDVFSFIYRMSVFPLDELASGTQEYGFWLCIQYVPRPKHIRLSEAVTVYSYAKASCSPRVSNFVFNGEKAQ